MKYNPYYGRDRIKNYEEKPKYNATAYNKDGSCYQIKNLIAIECKQIALENDSEFLILNAISPKQINDRTKWCQISTGRKKMRQISGAKFRILFREFSS